MLSQREEKEKREFFNDWDLPQQNFSSNTTNSRRKKPEEIPIIGIPGLGYKIQIDSK